MAKVGITLELTNDNDSQTLELLDDELLSVEVFYRLGTSWDFLSGMTVQYLGINRTKMESVLNMLSVEQKNRVQILNDIELMETEAMEHLRV